MPAREPIWTPRSNLRRRNRTRRGLSRRQFLAVSGGALVSVAAFGCGGEADQPEEENGASGEAGDRLRVVFWSAFGGDTGQALQQLVDDFNDSQDEIFVENQFQGEYEETAQQLATSMAAGEVPDMVILSDVTWNRFYLNESIERLTDYFDGDFSPEVYVDSLIEEGTREGEVWWVPFARSTPLFYYNREMFEEVGLPDRGPENWEELREWGPEIMQLEGEPAVHTFATGQDYNAWTFQGNVWQWGGRYSDDEFNILINEEPAIEAGEFIRRFVHEDGMGYMSDDQQVDFANGLTATALMSTGSLGGTLEASPFEVGTAMLPEWDEFGCPTGGAGIAIMAAAADERKEAAFEFIRFAAQPENVAFWTRQTGYMPVTEDARESSEMQSYFEENPEFTVAVEQLPLTRPQDFARTIVPNGDQTIGQGLESILTNDEPAESAFANVARQLEEDAEDVREQALERMG